MDRDKIFVWFCVSFVIWVLFYFSLMPESLK